ADLAQRALGSLEGKRIVVLGAGEMSELATTHLVSHGASELLVANRTVERAERLAELPGVHPVPLEDIPRLVANADIVIASTGAGFHLLTPDMLAGREQPLVIIDLGVPRDVDPEVGKLPCVRLYNVDQLDEAIAVRQQGQEEDLVRVRAIVEEEMAQWREWHASLGAVPTIAALRDLAESVCEAEVERSLARLKHLSERDRREVAALAQAVAAKLIHRPISRLKTSPPAPGYLDVARDLFGLDEDTVAPSQPPAGDEPEPAGERRSASGRPASGVPLV
ncbi:MAG: glutamyl-tRNA reductase, partial [Chloroflexota bacterium]